MHGQGLPSLLTARAVQLTASARLPSSQWQSLKADGRFSAIIPLFRGRKDPFNKFPDWRFQPRKCFGIICALCEGKISVNQKRVSPLMDLFDHWLDQ
jgi:hypothetical protein